MSAAEAASVHESSGWPSRGLPEARAPAGEIHKDTGDSESSSLSSACPVLGFELNILRLKGLIAKGHKP